MRVNIITLSITDLEKSTAFYQAAFGVEPASMSNDNITFFQLNGLVFSLYPKDKLAEDIGMKPEGNGIGGVTLAHNTKSEAEVDELLNKAEALGAKIIKSAQKVFWGGYSGYFSDLDGHLWEVAYNPFVEFDERDILKLST